MAVLLELLALLRCQQRENLVLRTDPQNGQLAVSFRGAIRQSLHVILVVLWRLVEITKRLVRLSKRL